MKLILLLIPLIFLSSCTINWNDEKDNIFEKNKECFSYKEKILENGKGGYINSLSLKEVFYSPKNNSCIFTVTNDNVYEIRDYLNNVTIEQYSGPIVKCGGISRLGSEEFTKCSKEIEDVFSKKIKELKGE